MDSTLSSTTTSGEDDIPKRAPSQHAHQSNPSSYKPRTSSLDHKINKGTACYNVVSTSSSEVPRPIYNGQCMDENTSLLHNSINESHHDIIKPTKPPRRITVEPIIIVYHMAILSLQPLLQQYVYASLSQTYNVTHSKDEDAKSRGGEHGWQDSLKQNPERKATKHLEDEIALWNILMLFCNLIPSVFTTILLGSYADRAGRKKMILPPLIGSSFATLGIALYLYMQGPLWIMLILISFSGLAGGLGSINLGCFAYMCDISSKSDRFKKMFLVEICTGLGTFAAQISTGYLIEHTGFFYPVLIQCGMLSCVLVYALVFLEEPNKDVKPSSGCCPKWSALFTFYFKDDGSGRRLILQLTYLLLVTIVFLDQGVYNILTFFFLDLPFCWGPDIIGLFNGTSFMMKTLGGIILTAILAGRLHETTMIAFGCFSYVGFFLCLAFAERAELAFTGAACGFGTYLALPMVRAVSSQQVDSHELGALFAGLTSSQILVTVLGTLAFNPLYAATALSSHGLVCLVAAGCMVIPLIINSALRFRLKRSTTKDPSVQIYAPERIAESQSSMYITVSARQALMDPD